MDRGNFFARRSIFGLAGNVKLFFFAARNTQERPLPALPAEREQASPLASPLPGGNSGEIEGLFYVRRGEREKKGWVSRARATSGAA